MSIALEALLLRVQPDSQIFVVALIIVTGIMIDDTIVSAEPTL